MTTIVAKKKKNKDDYGHSAAKYYLEQDLLDGTIPLDWRAMSYQVAFASRPEYAQFDGARLFQGRLQRARARAKADRNTGAQELAALKADRTIYPEKTTDHCGNPLWEGSQAQAFLIMDVRLGNHKNIKPADFRLTRTVYLQFPLDVFRNHIYQQEKREKWVAHLQRTQKKKFNLSDEAA